MNAETFELFEEVVPSDAPRDVRSLPVTRAASQLGRFPAGSQPVETSEAAASSLTPETLDERRRKVLLWFVSRGERGGTADEAVEAFGAIHNSIAPRVSELLGIGMLERTSEKRRTRQGSPAYVHVASELGRRVVRKVG